jgi:hypothetical protein
MALTVRANLGLITPAQRVPALRRRRRPLPSVASSNSLPEQASTIERFIGTANAPGMIGGKDQSPTAPSHVRKQRGETVRSAERWIGVIELPVKSAWWTDRRRRNINRQDFLCGPEYCAEACAVSWQGDFSRPHCYIKILQVRILLEPDVMSYSQVFLGANHRDAVAWRRAIEVAGREAHIP